MNTLHYPFLMAVGSTLLLSSCFEKDERVPPYPGEVVLIEMNIKDNEVYFDFESTGIISSNSIEDWQLSFESSDTGWHVLVNSGAGWFLLNTHQQNMDVPDEIINTGNWRYDIQNRYPDSTAAGNWKTGTDTYTGNVYVLGHYSGGRYQQKKFIRFLHADSFEYRFFYIDEESEFSDTVTIVKNDSVNFIYYDFIYGMQKNLEPPKNKYDIVFTSYYDMATQFGLTLPYLVRGAFLNTAGVMAVSDSLNSFNSIDYEDLGSYEFSSLRDVIGYRWKDVSVNPSEGSAEYRVRHDMSYIVRTMEGNYVKLRFLSFSYNGESGYPQFEYEFLVP